MNIETRLKKLEKTESTPFIVAVQLDDETESQCRERLKYDGDTPLVFITQTDNEL